MTLMILTARPELATNRRLAEAAARLGCGCDVVDVTRATSIMDPSHPELLVGDHNHLDPKPEAVIARVGNWRPESLLAALECATACGVHTPNPAESMRVARDHWRTVMRLRQSGIPVPESMVGMDPELTAQRAVERFGLPAVVKLRRSRKGIGVILCRTLDHLQSVLDSLWRLGDEFLVQQFIPADGVSTRALVVGGRVVAAARFASIGAEWRSNAALGGAATPIDLQTAERDHAVAAGAALGLGVCAVDLLAGPGGVCVCEVNPTPGFIRLEQATGIDVADSIVRYTLT